jgi:hypothetical protein
MIKENLSARIMLYLVFQNPAFAVNNILGVKQFAFVLYIVFE